MSDKTDTALAFMPQWQRDVISAAREYGHEVRAAEVAGVPISLVRAMRKSSAEFGEAMDEALEVPCGRLFGVMLKRAIEGDKLPVSNGKEILVDADGMPVWQYRFDSRIQETMAKALMPGQFREPKNAPVGSDGLPGGRPTLEKLFEAMGRAQRLSAEPGDKPS